MTSNFVLILNYLHDIRSRLLLLLNRILLKYLLEVVILLGQAPVGFKTDRAGSPLVGERASGRVWLY